MSGRSEEPSPAGPALSAAAGRGQSEGEKLRLFVAIELPESWRDGLGRLQNDLRRDLDLRGHGLRWTATDGIHLTLKFLGEVEAARRPAIESVLSAAVAGARRLQLRPGRLASFGNRGRPRLLWLGVDGDLDALAGLAAAIDAGFALLGFPRETRPFAAHLTLARINDNLDLQARQRVESLAARPDRRLDAPEFAVEEVCLIRSNLGRDGARYETLLRVGLAP